MKYVRKYRNDNKNLQTHKLFVLKHWKLSHFGL